MDLTQRIEEMIENQREAAQQLQAATQQVAELQALIQRQTGFLTALRQLQEDEAAASNGVAAAEELEEIAG
jgi:protein-arginine kinase|tara:strand:- start:561 stop:773 length:213 start_codon:yes stop_codon:yes gene_type:complete